VSRALFIGRFQPFHWGHFKAVRRILERESGLIIVVAAAQYSHTLKNPFTAGERVEMIHNTIRLYLPDADVVVIPVVDIEDNALRVRHLERMLPPFEVVYSNNPLVRQLFTEAGYEVKSIPLFNRRVRSAKRIRKMIIEGDPSRAGLVPGPVAEVIMRVIDRFRIFRETDEPERAFSRDGGRFLMFIVFEGIDGSGKDSVIMELVRLIEGDVAITHEPTYRIRAIIGEFSEPEALMHLFVADRIEHAKYVKKLLNEGKIVLQSRSFMSTLVYQGEEEDRERILEINERALRIAKPDAIFFLDVDVEVAEKRLKGDRFERRRAQGKLRELREKYIKASKRLSEKGFKVYVINVNGKSPREIAEEIVSILRNDFGLPRSLGIRFYS